MALREVDAISNAIIATEKEIAEGAWGQEQDETEDGEQDRSLEDMGDGLEGQHEAEDDDADGDDADGDDDSEAESEAETAEAEAAAAAAKAAAATGKAKDGEVIAPVREPEGGRVPSGKLREAAERARLAEARVATIEAESDKRSKSLEEKLDMALRQIDDLRRAPRAEPPKPAEPPKAEVVPDIFEDPKGFADHITKGVQTELSKRDTQLANQRVETSMAIAHAFHKDTFEKAFAEINKLNVQDPDARQTVQRIYNSPNPGEALVAWHKRNETFARVGDDPAKFEETIRTQTREALMKDPEFRKALLAELRKDAAQGDNGIPRTTTRLPGSLHRAGGSNLGADRTEMHASDDSEQGVADAAWR